MCKDLFIYEVIGRKTLSLHEFFNISKSLNCIDIIPEIKVLYILSNKNEVELLKKKMYFLAIHKVDSFYCEMRSTGRSKSTKSITSLWSKQWDIHQVTENGKSYITHCISPHISIGIIDSGIDYNHADIKESILPGSKNFVPKGGYKNKEEYETGKIEDVTDYMGHGTGVAGQITGNGYITGVAPGVKIRSYKVFSQGKAQSNWIIKAIIQAVLDGNSVINLSFGEYLMYTGKFSNSRNDFTKYEAYNRAIEFANSHGSLIVAAVGNESTKIDNQAQLIDTIVKKRGKSIAEIGKIIDCPAQLNNVVTVASTDISRKISNFSNYSFTDIDFYAPGGSTTNYHKLGSDNFIKDGLYERDWIISTSINNSYNYFFGTSFAAPKVSAALALIIDKFNYYDTPKKAITHLLSGSVNHKCNPINIYNSLNYKII
ncbi:S8 family peptidase [Staphylococcus hominis]|uniref:S8 family peptidase n=1 Tax=Staphylococcus hominis TaxID=1290 RepID=UPI0028784C5A|nr:S8 family serine peptidase [Staphylococcus hominis]MDS3898912.1 S8 family serine peptidase [Staphylococcus hominis]